MTHDAIFHRACSDLRHSTSARMLSVAKKYYDLFEKKCLDDGLNPQLIMAYSKVATIMYEERKKYVR